MVQRLQKPYICFDTNILIFLAGLDNGDPKTINFIERNKRTKKMLHRFLKMIQTKEIEVVVLPSVYGELAFESNKFGLGAVNFLRKYNCLYMDLTFNQESNYNEEVEILASKYVEGLQPKDYASVSNKNGSNKKYANLTKMNYFHNKVTDIDEPSTDSYIMAEASVLGLPLVTHNERHFLRGELPSSISSINKVMGYNRNSIPLSCHDFFQIYNSMRGSRIYNPFLFNKLTTFEFPEPKKQTKPLDPSCFAKEQIPSVELVTSSKSTQKQLVREQVLSL